MKSFKQKVHERNKKQGRANFVSGMAYEFLILKRERKKAIFAIRSAGSHTLIDIIAERADETRLISVRKNGTWLTKELEELVALKEGLIHRKNHNVYLAYQDKVTKKNIIERI